MIHHPETKEVRRQLSDFYLEFKIPPDYKFNWEEYKSVLINASGVKNMAVYKNKTSDIYYFYIRPPLTTKSVYTLNTMSNPLVVRPRKLIYKGNTELAPCYYSPKHYKFSFRNTNQYDLLYLTGDPYSKTYISKTDKEYLKEFVEIPTFDDKLRYIKENNLEGLSKYFYENDLYYTQYERFVDMEKEDDSTETNKAIYYKNVQLKDDGFNDNDSLEKNISSKIQNNKATIQNDDGANSNIKDNEEALNPNEAPKAPTDNFIDKMNNRDNIEDSNPILADLKLYNYKNVNVLEDFSKITIQNSFYKEEVFKNSNIFKNFLDKQAPLLFLAGDAEKSRKTFDKDPLLMYYGMTILFSYNLKNYTKSYIETLEKERKRKKKGISDLFLLMLIYIGLKSYSKKDKDALDKCYNNLLKYFNFIPDYARFKDQAIYQNAVDECELYMESIT